MKLISVFSILFLSGLASGALAADISSGQTWQNQILADARALYEPLALSQGKQLVIEVDLNGKLVVASAEHTDSEHKVVIQQGMIESPRLTPDGLRITLCHELGHIYGGAPRRYNPVDWGGPVAADGFSVMSGEGQADYYATMVCFRKLVRGQDHLRFLDSTKVTAEVQSRCGKAWGEDLEGQLICQRAMVGSLDFLKTVMEFPISFATPDKTIATRLDRGSYPLRQCRLDTLAAGAVCRDEQALQLDINDTAKSECAQAEARRPVCWFPR